MLTVKNGYLVCPSCGVNKRVMQIPTYTKATRVVAFCRRCKWEQDVDIDKGACFLSQGQ